MGVIYLFICSQSCAWGSTGLHPGSVTQRKESQRWQLSSPRLCKELSDGGLLDFTAVKQETQTRALDLQVSPSREGGIGTISDALRFPITKQCSPRKGHTCCKDRTPLERGSDPAPWISVPKTCRQRARPTHSWRYTCQENGVSTSSAITFSKTGSVDISGWPKRTAGPFFAMVSFPWSESTPTLYFQTPNCRQIPMWQTGTLNTGNGLLCVTHWPGKRQTWQILWRCCVILFIHKTVHFPHFFPKECS